MDKNEFEKLGLEAYKHMLDLLTVARAIEPDFFIRYDKLKAENRIAQNGQDWAEVCYGTKRQYCFNQAKAAIAAMREPTDKMKKFRTNNVDIFDWNCKCYYCGGHKFAVQAYIDAALKEG